MNPSIIFASCGLGFGIYMVLMGKSQVNGAITYLVLSIITLLASVLFFMIKKPVWDLSHNQIYLVVGASLINGIAGAALFTLLAKIDPSKTGLGLVTMVIVQMASAFILAAILSKSVPSVPQITGIILAILAIFLINK